VIEINSSKANKKNHEAPLPTDLMLKVEIEKRKKTKSLRLVSKQSNIKR